MQGDLISRAVLIDKLQKWKFANEERGYDTASDLVQEMIDLTEEQPTAYSVEDVVAELEEIGTEEAKQYLTRPRGNGKSFTVGYIKGFEKAMEIVRNGGKE